MESIINLLNKLSFSDSEAKVYISLLKHGSSTGYGVSKTSSVPRSKIYNVLEILITKGLVICTENTNPILYRAVPIEEMLKNMRYDFEQTIRHIKSELNNFDQKLNPGYIWQIRESDNVFNKCRNVLKKTEKELYLQIWKEDFDKISDEVMALEKNNLSMSVILFSQDKNNSIPLKNYYIHENAEEKLLQVGGRWITLVSDSREVIFGLIYNKNNAEVMWTESLPLVFMSKDYVKHATYFYRAFNA